MKDKMDDIREFIRMSFAAKEVALVRPEDAEELKASGTPVSFVIDFGGVKSDALLTLQVLPENWKDKYIGDNHGKEAEQEKGE